MMIAKDDTIAVRRLSRKRAVENLSFADIAARVSVARSTLPNSAETIGIVLESDLDCILSVAAVLSRNSTAAVVPAGLAPGEIRDRLAAARASVVLTDSGRLRVLKPMQATEAPFRMQVVDFTSTTPEALRRRDSIALTDLTGRIAVCDQWGSWQYFNPSALFATRSLGNAGLDAPGSTLAIVSPSRSPLWLACALRRLLASRLPLVIVEARRQGSVRQALEAWGPSHLWGKTALEEEVLAYVSTKGSYARIPRRVLPAVERTADVAPGLLQHPLRRAAAVLREALKQPLRAVIADHSAIQDGAIGRLKSAGVAVLSGLTLEYQ